MILEIQKFLQQKSFEDLHSLLRINISQHKDYSNLYLFKYDQIESPKNHPIVIECRGIVLDKSQNWKVVSYPYNRFFNVNEQVAVETEDGVFLKTTDINWESAKIYEKLDGSLCTLYFYDNKWNVSTSGTPDASGEVQGFSTHYLNFADLFWQTWNNLGYKLPENKNCCYMFELMTPFNRVVVQHQTARIALHGVRDLTTLQELNPSDFASQGWEIVKQYSLKTLDEVFEACKALDPVKNEGFVVIDDQFNRVKIKSPAYVALSHMKDGFSQRRMLQLVMNNESEEFLSYFSEFTALHNEIKTKYMCLILDIQETYEKIKDIAVQKDFALEACKHKFSGVLFSMRKGVTLTDYLKNVNIKTLENFLGI